MQDGPTDILRDPGRLAALHETALVDARNDDAFDRLTRVASRVLASPVALVVLVEGDRQFFRSHVGLPEPYSRTRQTPLTHSFCQHIVLTREPLVIDDAREHPEFRDDPAIRDLRVIAYLGVPLRSLGDHVLGSLCVIDHEPRAWTDDDVALLTDLAGSVMTEIELRLTVREAEAAAQGQAAMAAENAALYRDADRKAREEEALRHAAQALGASFTEAEVVQQIARSALHATGADGAFVKQIDPARGEVEVVAVAGAMTPPRGSRAAYAGSFTERAVDSEESAIVDDISDSGQTIALGLDESCAGCSALIVPLLDDASPIGSLVLLRAPARSRFYRDEIDRARTFADLAALAFRKVRLLQESERRREDLERLTESRVRLMRGFSHDVKNPLGAADGYAQLLEDGVIGELTDRQKESVGRIRRSLRSSLALIDDLLELARAEAGQVEIRRAPTDVRDAVREMAEEYRAQAEAKGLTLEIRVPDEVPVIHSDTGRVRQILGNLVSNAVKYTPDGTITVAVDTREDPGAPGPGEWVAVAVRDTGPGIPRDQQHLLFQEFARIEPGTGTGAGIGLAISRRLASALGGDITLDSDAGQGATFTLWLPLELVRDRDAAA